MVAPSSSAATATPATSHFTAAAGTNSAVLANYIPRKCLWTERNIAQNDHGSVILNLACGDLSSAAAPGVVVETQTHAISGVTRKAALSHRVMRAYAQEQGFYDCFTPVRQPQANKKGKQQQRRSVAATRGA